MDLLDNIEVRDLGNLELLAKQVVEGFIIGLHKSPFHGFSVEFAEHRVYNPGESTKNMDWKVYARTDRMYIKRFEEETNLRCQIVIDASSSMYFPEPKFDGKKKINKLLFSSLAGAALMNMLKKQRDAFGLSIFDSEVQTHTKCKSSTVHYRLLMSMLQKLIDNPENNKKTSTAAALHQIADSVHRRSLVMIFSDMFDQGDKADELFSALQHLKHNKHEVVLFQVVDKSKELQFNFDNRPKRFVDVETGEAIDLYPENIKVNYKKAVSTYFKNLRLKCGQYRIKYVEADINAGFNSILTTYMIERQKFV